MAPKEIIVSPRAERELKKLPKQDKGLALEALSRFEAGELLDTEKIKSHPAFYRIKIRHLRLIYYPLSLERVVLLVVKDRKDAYRGLGVLDKRLEIALCSIRDQALQAIAGGKQ